MVMGVTSNKAPVYLGCGHFALSRDVYKKYHRCPTCKTKGVVIDKVVVDAHGRPIRVELREYRRWLQSKPMPERQT